MSEVRPDAMPGDHPDEPAKSPEPPRGRLQRLLGRMPTLLVLGGLVALAIWGHYTGWTIPKFSQLAGERAVEKEDWCIEHNVPDSQCIACHPELGGVSAADW